MIIKARHDIFYLIAQNYRYLPEASGLNLDIACEDMQDEMEEKKRRYIEAVIFSSLFTLAHIVGSVLWITAICPIFAVMFSGILLWFVTRLQALIAVSTATVSMVREKDNVAPNTLTACG